MPPAARIPLALWEREKEHIRALYLDQDKKLDELVKCMAEDHGLYATRAQYIRRLDNWKMRKNHTKEEWGYVDSLVRKRKLEGKESEIIMDGKPISDKKLKKELGRYGQPRSLEQPYSIPPKDALESIIARTPPATERFNDDLVTCATVPWFLFHDTFIPIVISVFEHVGGGNARQSAIAKQTSSLARTLLGEESGASSVARTITEKLPKKPGAYALQTQSSVPDHFIQILCWAVYQSSNNLLSDDQTDNFLQWIIKHGNIQFLQQFTQISDSVTRVLMANLLFSAIRLNSKETVQFLLENGTKPSIIHRISRETVLQLAIKDELSNAEIVRLLLEHGACPNATCVGSTDERSPLCLAMMDLPRKSSIAEMLVLAGADVDVSYSDTKYPGIHKTPLIVAAAQEDAFLTGLLLEKGANPNDFYPGSRSALHAADRSNRPGSVEALLKAGADANIPYGEGKRPNFNHVFKHFSQDSPYDALYSLLTPIDIAYKNGNSKIVDLLLQANAHADGCLAFVANWDRSAGCMALQDAARRGKRHLVESLLMAGVDVNAPPCHDGGRTALQAAAESGNIDMVQLLLDRGAFVNAPPCSSGGLTALQAAIYSRDLDLIELLMREGGRINAEAARYGGSTCFEAAVSTGDIDLVNTLLALGADINPTCYYPDGREISALTWSISQHNRQLFDLLMSKGARPDLPQDCPTPLFAAIEVGSFDMAVRLIEAGADVNRPSRVGDARLDSYSLQTPLQTAIKQGDKKLINLLIESHADINYSHDGTQFGAALKSAISCKNREAVQLLLSRGAHPGRTASLASVIPDAGSHVDLEIFRMLISHNAEVNPLPWDSPFFQAFTKLQYPAPAMAPQGLRLTPFQTALERGHEELASMLLEAGADVNAPAFWRGGKTALQAAAMSGSFSFVESLVSRGADINAPPAREHGATALQFAAIQGHYNIVVLLLENGADINAPRAAVGGRTALEGAAEHGRLDIVHLLLENDKQEESLGQRRQGAAVFAETYGHFVIAETLRGWKKT